MISRGNHDRVVGTVVPVPTVVAGEVENPAEETSAATMQIVSCVSEIQAAMSGAVEGIHAGSRK